MSDDYQYIDVNDEQWDGTPRALREALDKAQKALRAERQATADLRNQQASSALSDVLAGFKNPERVKSHLLGDKVDPLDSEAVTRWLESNGDDFARATDSAPAQTEATAPEAGDQPVIPDYGRINGVAEIGTPAVAGDLQAIASMPEGLSKQEAYQWLAARA